MATETITLKLVAQDLMTGNVSKAIAGLDKLAKRGGLVGSVIQGVGMSFGQMLNPIGLVTKGIGAVTDAIGESISAASHQDEALSKVTVVFGEQADAIKAWANTAATSMGMSETAALDAAGTLGNLFDALGLTNDQTLDMSKSIVQLGADLASFNDVTVDEALTALKSGLVGETEPMRNFGSNLSAARVEAFALSSGMAKTKSAITDAIKVQARYALILQDTKNAQGDVARTSDSLANSQKRLDSQIQDLSADLGHLVVGPAADFVGFLSELITQGRGANVEVRKLIDNTAGITKAMDKVSLASKNWGTDLGLPGYSEFQGIVSAAVAEAERFAESIKGVAVAAGATKQDVVDLFFVFKDVKGLGAAEAMVKTEEALRGLAIAATIGGRRTLVGFRLISDGAEEAADGAADAFAGLPDSLEDSLNEAREAAKQGAAEIAFALAHPMAGGKLEKIYSRNIHDAMAAIRKGQKTGNNALITEGQRLVRVNREQLSRVRAAHRRTATTAETTGERIATAEEEVSTAVTTSVTLTAEQLAIARRLYGTTATKAETAADRIKAAFLEINGGGWWGYTGPDPNAGGIDVEDPGSGAFGGQNPWDRASGGPVLPGRRYTVGEQGPETLLMGRSGGYVLPNRGGGGRGGLTIVYAPQYSTATAAEAERFAQAATPGIVREMRRIGAA